MASFAIFAVIVTLAVSTRTVYGSDFIPDRICAKFTWNTARGEKDFHLLDFEQSYDLYEIQRFREVTSHLPLTEANVLVSAGCRIEVCQLEYYRGSCNDFVNSGEDEAVKYPVSDDIRSARCRCQRYCSCRIIEIPKDFSANPILGRGYFGGGCSTCDSEYVALRTCESAPVWKNKLESIILRSGCTLVVYSQQNFNGEQRVIRESVFKDSIEVHSYKIVCSDEEFVAPTTPPVGRLFPKKITLPRTKEEFYELQKSNKTLAEHPGFATAARSIEKRSHRRGYVVILGTHQASKGGFPQCQDGPTNEIGECHIPFSLDHLGLSTELHVITVPMIADFQTNLGKYLTTHEELKGIRPNVVIMYHALEDDYTNVNSSTLQVKLQTLLALEERLLINLNLNFMVVLDAKRKTLSAADAAHYLSLFTPVIHRGIEPAWNRNETFQRLCIAWTADIESQTYFINGNARLLNGEFWPRNWESCILKRTDRTGDKLGAAIMLALIYDNTIPHRSIKPLKGTAQQPSTAVCALS